MARQTQQRRPRVTRGLVALCWSDDSKREDDLRLLSAAAFIALLFVASLPKPAAAQEDRQGTGLPLPRYVSLKSDEVNVRRGPGEEYEVAFTFVRRGLPVEIIQEFDNWRKIRDSDGAEGWVFHSLLAGDRTALVAPWQSDGKFPAYQSASTDSAIVAYLAPRVVVRVEECTGSWCHIEVQGYECWIAQESLWGVYPDEVFEN
jgi:SH3-like domain-containing protein